MCLLRRMFVSIAGFLNTAIVDCDSRRIQLGSIPLPFDCASVKAYCVRVVPVVVTPGHSPA